VSRYPTNGQDGRKSIIVGTTSPLGSHNSMLGGSYLTMAGVSFIILVFFISLFIRKNMEHQYSRVNDHQ
jgi:hypothetical protein